MQYKGLACKLNIPFFFAHSKLSKSLIENIDYLLKTTVIELPQIQQRLLDGSLINMDGKLGRSVETDLLLEHSVRNKKDLIRRLGAIKSGKFPAITACKERPKLTVIATIKSAD